jgi:nicotinate phosphoribosyltransferase
MSIDLQLEAAEIPLLNDLYEFTVSAAFFDRGMNEPASFDVGVRRLAPSRGFMVVGGVERILEVLENFHFEPAAVAHLESLGLFKPEFLDYLSRMRFSGAVRAMPEGSLYFGGEPVMEVHAPLIEAQIMEPIVLNQLGVASIIATKAARCYGVAGGRRLVEFGLRRSQGADAALVAGRSTYLGGFDGTSNVLAGRRYGIPVFGTMSHSFVMAHDDERSAFEDFARSFPSLATILVDTYDTVRGVRNTAELALKLRDQGVTIRAIRLDSGDLDDLSRQARRILDDRGLTDVAIFASGNLNEFRVDALVKAGAPIDAFGVGTAVVVSDDAPAADYTYKLSEYRGRPRLKTSAAKVTMPGRKQVFRAIDSAGRFIGDLVGLIDESVANVTREFRPTPDKVTPLLETVFEDGRRLMPRPTLGASRERFLKEFGMLGERHRALANPAPYPVRPTAALNAMMISEKLRAETLQE